MQIGSSAITLASQTQFTQRSASSMSMRFWVGDAPPPPMPPSTPTALRPESLAIPRLPLPRPPVQDEVTISPAARQIKPRTEDACKCAKMEDADLAISDPEMRMFVMLMEKMFGKKFKIFDMAEETKAPKQEIQTAPQNAEAAQPPTERVGWGFELRMEESYYEAESMSFAAQGTILTKDGKAIQFQLQLEMSREYFRQDGLHIRLGDAALTDPLVINFDGTAAQLSDKRFKFDLDSNGVAEEIPTLAPGSGFLALDKNGDGRITNGKELFGPTLGDGFRELAAHDADGNGWIDSNDAIYNQLRILEMDSAKQRLYTLQEKKIGALYLNAIDTPFTVKDSQNSALGQVARSSIFVQEDGNVGSVQRVDLAT